MEGPPSPEPEGEIEESESIEQQLEKHTLLVDRFEGMGKFGLAAGIFSIGFIKAHDVIENIAEESAFQEEYSHYLEDTLSQEDRDSFESLKTQLAQEFGEEAVREIELADKTAYRHRDEEPQEPAFLGFENVENEYLQIHFQTLIDYAFTEEYKLYPENWINGEISAVAFTENKDPDGPVLEQLLYNIEESKGAVLILDQRERITDDNVYYIGRIIGDSFPHEVGHANDWRTSSKFNLLERAELLADIQVRMNSENALDDFNTLDSGVEYWRSKLDGTPNGKYLAALEYWAEICKAYFDNPRGMLKERPDDFAIVDKYVKMTDQDFDIFDPDRGAFDTHTGKIKDVWQQAEE